MTRITALRLLPVILATLLVLPATGDLEFGIGGLFFLWGLMTLLLCSLFGALWGKRRQGRDYPSGGDL